MANNMMIVIMIGLALVFIPLVIIGLTFMGGANWESVGQQVTLPILAVFILGICGLFLKQYL